MKLQIDETETTQQRNPIKYSRKRFGKKKNQSENHLDVLANRQSSGCLITKSERKKEKTKKGKKKRKEKPKIMTSSTLVVTNY